MTAVTSNTSKRSYTRASVVTSPDNKQSESSDIKTEDKKRDEARNGDTQLSPIVKPLTIKILPAKKEKPPHILDRRCKEYRDHLLPCYSCGKKGAPANETNKDVLLALRPLKWSCSDCLPSMDGVCVLCRGLAADFVCQSCMDSKRREPSVFHHSCLFADIDYQPGNNVCPDCRDGVTEKDVKGDLPSIVNLQQENIEPAKLNGCNGVDHQSVSKEIEGEILTKDVYSPVNGDNNILNVTPSLKSDDSVCDSTLGRGSTSPPVTITTTEGISFRSRRPETWTVAEVESFFSSSGFSLEGSVFREQEIDGKSLLLLKREDVLKGLPGIKVGPALKIFSFIHHLQNFFVVTPDRD